MPLRPLAHGPTAAAPADVLARFPRAADGSPVPQGTWALASSAPVAMDDDGAVDADEADDRHLVVDIDGFIGWWYSDATYFKRVVRGARPDRITLRIASPGGLVADCIDIHDFLLDYARTESVPVTTVVAGMTASAATVIAVAANREAHPDSRVLMSENALFLVHKPWGCVCGTDADLAVAAREFQTFNRVFHRVYARKTGLTTEQCAAHIGANNGAGEWWDAETCLANGYVDEVYRPGDGALDVETTAQAHAGAAAPQARRDAAAVAQALGLPPIPGAPAAPAGDASTTGAPGAPVDEAALAALQESLDGLAGAYATDVALAPLP